MKEIISRLRKLMDREKVLSVTITKDLASPTIEKELNSLGIAIIIEDNEYRTKQIYANCANEHFFNLLEDRLLKVNQNLLSETLETLKRNNVSEQDIYCIRIGKYQMTWSNFKDITNIEYNSGFGGAEIPCFEIIGKNFFMTRWEYDGSEGWVFHDLNYEHLPIKTYKELREYIHGSGFADFSLIEGDL